MLTLVAGSGASYYQYAALAEQTETVVQLRVDTRPTPQIEAEVEKSAEKLADCAAQLVHLEQGVPQFAYVPTLLYELEKLGNSTGIEVLGVRPLPPPAKSKDEKPKKSAYQELDIEVKGRGDYESVMSFVQALQTFPKIVEARMISLTPKNDSNTTGKPRLEVEVQLRTYLFPPPKGMELMFGEPKSDHAKADPMAVPPDSKPAAQEGSH